ncbi:hypothetical protein PPYR_12518 [Photinus pyralis]|uniref:Protein sleepless n=1 Tax=Photinus pyralis TaxID=7054 RepID=A0A1Y1KGF1_PHOPY|nr:uncharacterized protein LOC116178640 [Photinus pyralis]KAB0792898.1 hypothetical protein PPYR_12518 [Photinus pyralis]
MDFSKMVFVWILVLCLVQLGASLDCFSCTTLKSNKCQDTFEKQTAETVRCDEPGYGCMKQIVSATGQQPRTTHRGCTPQLYCDSLKGISDHCSVCDTQLCNSSSPTGLSLLIGSIILIAAWLI